MSVITVNVVAMRYVLGNTAAVHFECMPTFKCDSVNVRNLVIKGLEKLDGT